jgi:hypothetical protein
MPSIQPSAVHARWWDSEVKEERMEASDLWVANGEGTEIIRAREIAAVSLDYNGNVTARLVGYNSTVVTLVAHRTGLDENKPGDLHRQVLRAVAQIGDSSGAHLVRPVHDQPHGWQWVSEAS